MPLSTYGSGTSEDDEAPSACPRKTNSPRCSSRPGSGGRHRSWFDRTSASTPRGGLSGDGSSNVLRSWFPRGLHGNKPGLEAAIDELPEKDPCFHVAESHPKA